ncbi:MAG: hypothetical protein KIT72_05030 [Polyangiaceae bacterium]|nr:hypothetical protein [Polyangiaceae bacterium]MCW5789767.1 hypothetical protein [Polyangiaceae bacterium]
MLAPFFELAPRFLEPRAALALAGVVGVAEDLEADFLVTAMTWVGLLLPVIAARRRSEDAGALGGDQAGLSTSQGTLTPLSPLRKL